MKMLLSRIILAGLLAAIGLAAHAQTIGVFDGNDMIIPAGHPGDTIFPYMHWADVQVMHSETVTYYMTNLEHGTTLNVSTVSITGPDASSFNFAGGSLPPLGSNLASNIAYFNAVFSPSHTGLHNATFEISSNDAHGSSSYSFSVSAMALADPPTAFPDLTMSAASVPKCKLKKGAFEVSGKLLVKNNSSVQMDEGLVMIYVSPLPYVSQEVVNVQSISLKTLKGGAAGKFKSKKLPYKFLSNLEYGYVIALVLPTKPESDSNWIGNMSITEFEAPEK